MHKTNCHTVAILPLVTAGAGVTMTTGGREDDSVIYQLTDCLARTQKEMKVANNLRREELDLRKRRKMSKRLS